MSRWMSMPLLTVLAAGAAACELPFDEADNVYDGPPLVEFAPVMPEGSYSVGIDFGAGSDETRTVTVRVQYISAPPAADVTGEIMIADGSSAVEGEHYALPDGTDYTIPAGQNAAEVRVDLLGRGLDDGQSVVLVLDLVEGEGFDVSPNHKQFQITASKATS